MAARCCPYVRAMTREEHLEEFYREEKRLLEEMLDDLRHAVTAAEELLDQPNGSSSLWLRRRLWDEAGRRMEEARKSWQVIRPDGGVLEYRSGRLVRLAAICERKREK